jgi:hypothetical protein
MQPVPSAATYVASKAFVNTFAESLHGELRGTGVSCTLLAPGPVRTEFMAVGGAEYLEERRWFAWQSPETVARAGLLGARRGQRTVIPGPMAKLQALAGRHLPHQLTFVVLRTVILPGLRAPSAGSRLRQGNGRGAGIRMEGAGTISAKGGKNNGLGRQ